MSRLFLMDVDCSPCSTYNRLKPLDIEIMKRLGTRVNLIPVIAKADTMTPNDLTVFKQRIREVIGAQGIRIYLPPVDGEDDPGASEHARALADAMPFSIIGSTDDVVNAEGKTVKGREYLWGVAEGEAYCLALIMIADPRNSREREPLRFP